MGNILQSKSRPEKQSLNENKRIKAVGVPWMKQYHELGWSLSQIFKIIY